MHHKPNEHIDVTEVRARERAEVAGMDELFGADTVGFQLPVKLRPAWIARAAAG